MHLVPRSALSWTLIALVALSGACATTLTPAQRQRMSDCAAQCDVGREPLPFDPMGSPVNQHDTRTDCEKRCQ
jgi:hypothetical protein